MKGLRKYLTPFAPDQSGAVAMCYALGGMVVIVDAGGCAGNICGFDEPRWQPDYLPGFCRDGDNEETTPRVQAVFSAGLRDMDAILGRDDLLIRKLEDASKKIDAKFIALIGTPVPAVIGTDLAADALMAEKKTHLPCIAVSTDGMHLYDRGIEETLLVLMKTFAQEKPLGHVQTASHNPALPESSEGKQGQALEKTQHDTAVKRRRVCGVLGLNPLDLFDPAWTEAIRTSLLERGYDEVLLYGMEGGLDALKRSALAERNYVVSTAGIAAAKYLKERFGTPFEVSFPADPMILLEDDPADCIRSLGSDAQILVVHQQVLANAIRDSLKEAKVPGTVTVATWFDLKDELAMDGDVRLKEEDDFTALVRERHWDLIIADPTLRQMTDGTQGRWIDAFHFAVSGQAAIDTSRRKRGIKTGCLS